MKPHPHCPRSAFTLLELLVTVSVLVLLLAIIVPSYSRMVQSGRAAACSVNLRQLGVALNSYLGDHDMIFPTMLLARPNLDPTDPPTLDVVLAKYAREPRTFACPADNQRFFEKTGTSYSWNHLLNGQSAANPRFLIVEDKTRIPLFGDKEGFHPYLKDEINILYGDYRASQELKFFTPDDVKAD